MVPCDPARLPRPGSAAHPWSPTSTSRGDLPDSRRGHPSSTVSGAPVRSRSDRVRGRRARHWRSRDARRGPDRTCRRTLRRASLVRDSFAPLHLERADPHGVALLRAHRAELVFDPGSDQDRKSTRLNSSHGSTSYAVFCLKKKKNVLTPNLLKPKTQSRNVIISHATNK